MQTAFSCNQVEKAQEGFQDGVMPELSLRK